MNEENTLQDLVGKRVRCIDAVFKDMHGEMIPKGKLLLPEEGKEYTIRTCVQVTHGVYGITLVEIVNKPVEYRKGCYEEPVFTLSRFLLVPL